MTREKTTRGAACARLEVDLVLLHYGELSGAGQRHVEVHAKDCAACSEFLLELAMLLPKTLLADDPPSEFWNEYSRELRYVYTD